MSSPKWDEARHLAARGLADLQLARRAFPHHPRGRHGAMAPWSAYHSTIWNQWLAGGLEYGWIMTFHINWEWNNHPNWRSHIFQGLKPPTRYGINDNSLSLRLSLVPIGTLGTPSCQSVLRRKLQEQWQMKQLRVLRTLKSGCRGMANGEHDENMENPLFFFPMFSDHVS